MFAHGVKQASVDKAGNRMEPQMLNRCFGQA